MESKISQFVSLTGASTAVAKDLLHETNWSVDDAVKVYRFMHDAKPPPGPKKNIEAHQAASVSGGGTPPPVNRGATTVAFPPKSDVRPETSGRNPGLKRGISKTTENADIVTKARDKVLHDITEHDETSHYLETPEYTFVLPDISKYSEDFRAFLHKDLIETSTLVSLEQAGRLNWWADMGSCQRLLPLATTGDGNCLLHAASLAMWGFHDRMLTLRKALFKAMSSTQNNSSLYRRWRWQQSQSNKETGLIYTEEEWKTEWVNLLKLASTKPRTFAGLSTGNSCCDSPATKGMMERNTDDGDVFYESLEEFHVFLLAHVLMRPIIVVADNMLKDSNGEALAPIPFGGIYLPVDCDPGKCHKSPLLLTYDASHFSALVAMEHEKSPEDKPRPPAAIPLVDPEFKLLPIHYYIDPGEEFCWKNVGNPVVCKQMEKSHEQKVNLIRRYLTIEQVPISPAYWNGTDSEAGSEPRSRAGSMDSNAEETQNGKEKDKAKGAKQLNSVQKAFGSIGKSMSKKLKKNFGSVGKGLKDGSEKERRRPSVGSVTQSTKVSSITLEMLRDSQKDQSILAVKLSIRRPTYQEDMVKNYMTSAYKRFQQNREIRRQHDLEMKERTAELRGLDVTDGVRREGPSREMACINVGCEQRGTAATSWLCRGCYEKEKAQALNFAGGARHDQGAIVTSKPPPYQRPPSLSELERQNTLMMSGKSKFYTYANEDHSALDKGSDVIVRSGDLNNMKSQGAAGSKASRSTFYVDEVNSTGTSSSQQRPVSVTTSAKPPVNVQRTQGKHLGTAYIVNDLHDDVKLSNKEKSATLPSRLKEGFKLAEFDYMGEPPLRPEFGGPPIDTSRSNAHRIKGSADNVHQLSSAISSSNGSAGWGMQQKCRTTACDFYGSEATDFLCSTCWKDKRRTLAHIAQRK